MNISIIFNPAAGRRRLDYLEAVIQCLTDDGACVTLLRTQAAGHAEELARQYSAQADHRLVVAGGDGTINEVVNGLMKAGRGTLGIIPAGTANVLALEMGLGRSVERVVHTLLHGEERDITLGKVGDRYFLLMVGVGFDAHIVGQVNTRLKRLIGKGAYGWSSLVGLFNYPFPTIEITVDGQTYQAASIVVCNARRYGGDYALGQNTDLNTDNLEVCLFKTPGVVAAMRYGLHMVSNRFDALSDMERVTGTQMSIHQTDVSSDFVQADGELFGTLPVHIEAVPKAMRLLFPTV